MFDAVAEEAIAAYDRIVGLDLSEVSVDGSRHKAPSGGYRTGKNPCDRAKSGWKWSLATDANSIPVGWVTDSANRHDSVLFDPTLDVVDGRGRLSDIETQHPDRAYDNNPVRDLCHNLGITDPICARKRPRGQAGHTKLPTPLGMRWTVERTNSWPTNYGQLRPNTDRHIHHRQAQLALAITLIITIKLINWRNRWNPTNQQSAHALRPIPRTARTLRMAASSAMNLKSDRSSMNLSNGTVPSSASNGSGVHPAAFIHGAG